MIVADAAHEIFALQTDDSDQWMIYAPLAGKLSLVNKAAARETLLYAQNPQSSLESPIIRELIDSGYFEDEALPEIDVFEEFDYRPVEVTLFPTEQCNLRCTYCYARAAAEGVKLSWEIAKAAIEFVFDNAKDQKSGVSLLFHGGGEPTQGWPLIERALDFADHLSEQFNIPCTKALASNGVFSSAQAAVIAKRFDGITLSWDGPLQDQQRPLRNGKGSLSILQRNCRILSDSGSIGIHLRTTCTQSILHTLPQLPKLALELVPNLKSLQIEAAWASGRCEETACPIASEFVRYFLEAFHIAKQLKLGLTYSGFQVNGIRTRFCGVSSPGFTVLSNGIISACYEVKDAHDPRSEWAHFGAFDPNTQKFVFDPQKINHLRTFDVRHYDYCKDCFCKWHCAGDCIAKTVPTGIPSEHKGSPRCEINRSLTKAFLLESLQSQQTERTSQI